MIDPSTVIHRIDELRADIAAGERALRELDARRDELVAGLLRLSGAVQALDSVLAAAAGSPGSPVGHPAAR